MHDELDLKKLFECAQKTNMNQLFYYYYYYYRNIVIQLLKDIVCHQLLQANQQELTCQMCDYIIPQVCTRIIVKCQF